MFVIIHTNRLEDCDGDLQDGYVGALAVRRNRESATAVAYEHAKRLAREDQELRGDGAATRVVISSSGPDNPQTAFHLFSRDADESEAEAICVGTVMIVEVADAVD